MKQILLLHGALGSAVQFDELAAQLDKAFHVHRFDFSGHGANTSSGAITMPGLMQDIEHYMDVHNLKNIPVFGYSMGGYAALTLAAVEPGYISKLLTLGTKWHWNPDTARKETGMLQAATLAEKVPKYAAALEAMHRGIGWAKLLELTAGLMTQLGGDGGFSHALAARIQIPVRILLGAEDKMVTVEESEAIAQVLPKGDFKLLTGVPHPLERVNLDLLKSEIIEFIGS